MSRPADNRTFLEQMGIDVWVTRRPTDAPSEAAAASISEPARSDLPIARPKAAEPELTPVAAAGSALQSAPAIRNSVAPVAPFRVLSLQKGPALVLFEPGEGKASHRFVSDILSAASGIWGGEIAALTFDWPQPGIESDIETQRKALGAFVAKQVDDQLAEASDSVVIVASEVVNRLSQPPADCVLLPPLAALMVQADLKRALWAELEGRLQSPMKSR